MSGKAKRSAEGQLALMDALVFFVVALTISSILLFYARADEDLFGQRHAQGQCDPEAVLDVVLHASTGRDLTPDLEGGAHIAENAEVAECLALELDALAAGASREVFQSLNEVIQDILNATCGPAMEAYLVALQADGHHWRTLLALPSDPPNAANAYTATTELPGRDSMTYLIELVLTPATSSEVI